MAFSLLPQQKLKRSDFIILLNTLSWMINAGLSQKDGVEELLKDPNNKMTKGPLILLRDGLAEGKPLSTIFKDNENIFGAGYWRQMDAAERTGKVPECLTRIADQVQNSGDIIGKIKGAMAYPSFILVFAIFAGYYMFTTLIPEMAVMMAEFDVALPPLTVAIMGVSDFLIAYWLYIAVIMVFLVLGIRYLLTHMFQFVWHRTLTKLPYVGKISVNTNYSLAYVLLNDMIENGAHIVEALKVAAASATNIFIKQELLNAADIMDQEGVGLTEALINTSTMPTDDKLMLAIGSKTGREMELLPSLSKRRKAEANASVDAFMAIVPSIILVLVSGIVAIMVVAIYMPMITMATDIG